MKTFLLVIFPLLLCVKVNFKCHGQRIFHSLQGCASFIENAGQWDDDVFFLCRLKNVDVWITRSGADFVFNDLIDTKEQTSTDSDIIDTYSSNDHIVFSLEGSNPDCQPRGKKKLRTYYNYYNHADSSRWKNKVGVYEEVIISNIYCGIDLRYYFDNGNLRYDFIVHPFADEEKIKFSFKGKKSVLTQASTLNIFIPNGYIIMKDLTSYQGNRIIKSSFQNDGEYYSFIVGEYDRALPLFIDPVILVATLGGNGYEEVKDIVVDDNENIYITGITNSMDYPISQSAYQKVNRGSTDIFITKLDKDGQILFSTYLGGSMDEKACSIKLDRNGNVYIAGETGSTDFNVTSHAAQTRFGGGNKDAFVAKLNADGTRLFFATYLGGSQDDFACDMTIDEQGNTYITGGTRSSDFPITNGAFQKILKGSVDVFVTKLNPEGSKVIYSTLVGGENAEIAYAIATDKAGYVYFTGYTSSSNYPVTSGAYQSRKYGSDQVMVTRLNPTGTSLVFSTFLGGSRFDYGRDIAIDSQQYVYVLGETTSFDFPVTSEACQRSHAGGTEDVFIAKFDAKGKKLLFSTYLGGNKQDKARSIVLDKQGYIYIAGTTMSEDFPIISSAPQATHRGISDTYLTIFNTKTNEMLYSTFWGGPYDEETGGMAVDNNNIIYLTGQTYSILDDEKLTGNNKEKRDNYDVFIIKITP